MSVFRLSRLRVYNRPKTFVSIDFLCAYMEKRARALFPLIYQNPCANINHDFRTDCRKSWLSVSASSVLCLPRLCSVCAHAPLAIGVAARTCSPPRRLLPLKQTPNVVYVFLI